MAQTTATGLPTIGEVIRAWRLFWGLRSIDLAEKAGIRSQYLSEIEHNRTANPKEKYLARLADALEVPLQDIYGRRMPPENGGVGEEEDQRCDPSISGIVNPSLALTDSLLDTAYERIGALIESKHFSEEEMKRFTDGLVGAAELLSKALKPQHKNKTKVGQ